MAHETVASLRKRIHALPTGGGRRYPSELKRDLIKCVQRNSLSLKGQRAVLREVGLAWKTYARWVGEQKREQEVGRFLPVVVREAKGSDSRMSEVDSDSSQTGSVLRLYAPNGCWLEGFTLNDAGRLLSALSQGGAP